MVKSAKEHHYAEEAGPYLYGIPSAETSVEEELIMDSGQNVDHTLALGTEKRNTKPVSAFRPAVQPQRPNKRINPRLRRLGGRTLGLFPVQEPSLLRDAALL